MPQSAFIATEFNLTFPSVAQLNRKMNPTRKKTIKLEENTILTFGYWKLIRPILVCSGMGMDMIPAKPT